MERISIRGFKCFDSVTLQLKSINLLVGQNSIGKSTIIHAILCMKQDPKHPFSGRYINIGKTSELYNEYTGSDEIEIEAMEGDAVVGEILVRGLDGVVKKFKGLDTNIIYCSAERIGVQDVYDKPVDAIKIGNRCEYAFAYLSELSATPFKDETINYVYEDNTKHTFGGQVDYWLERILGYTVISEEIEQTELVRVLFRNNKMESRLRPKNVGTGVTYIAEIIIAAFSCEPGDMLIIENPEIHLHPSGQAEFVEFLSFISSLGIQVVLESHSDHIYNGLRRCIHQNLLSPEDVSVYFFKQNKEGSSDPVHVKIDDEGKATSEDGMFDQIKKDLDVILGW